MHSVLRRLIFQRLMDISAFLKVFVDYDLFAEGTRFNGTEVMGICKRHKTGGLILAKLDDDLRLDVCRELLAGISAELLEALDQLGVFDETYSVATINGKGADQLIIITRSVNNVLMWSPASKGFFLHSAV